MSEQPTALRLSDALMEPVVLDKHAMQAAAELRRLHAEVERLEKANRLLQQHHATAWNRGHTMGMHANETIAKQALDAVKNDAWGNTQLTEALMAAEAENEALRADAERWRTFLSTQPPNTHEAIIAVIDEARSKT